MEYNEKYTDKLSNLSDWKVEDNDKDVRGWDFVTQTGEKIGEVEDFIANTKLEKVVYLGVELADDMNQYREDSLRSKIDTKYHQFFGDDDDSKILVPVGVVKIDQDNKQVIASAAYNRPHFSSSPRVKAFDRQKFGPINELILVDYYTTDDSNYDKYRTEESYDSYKSRTITDNDDFYNNELYSKDGYFK